jgi:predicted negative regulator of RcsB-dependent stress response
LYYALLGEIYLKLNRKELSKLNFETAINLTKSEAEKRMMKNKIAGFNLQ